MFTAKFWMLATERALKSAAQAVAVAGVFSNTGPINAFELDLKRAGVAAASGYIVSYVTSMMSAPLSGDPDSPSLVPEK